MLWWGKKQDARAVVYDSGASRHGKGLDPLIAAVTQHFDPNAASELSRRGWRPVTPNQRIGFAIATASFHELAAYDDDAVEALKRASTHHEWSSGVLQVLESIGTEAAHKCLCGAIRIRWRSGRWDSYCAQSLNGPHGKAAMVAELADRFDPQVARLLYSVGWQPTTVEEHVSVCIANHNISEATQCGPDAVQPLIRALSHVQDSYAVLEALAGLRTADACTAVVETLHGQWKQGHSRWTDFNLVTGCGSKVIPPLIRLMAADPMHTSIVMEMLIALVERADELDDDDLQVVAVMADPRHLHYMPDDPRGYVEVVDCSSLRARARTELANRGVALGAPVVDGYAVVYDSPRVESGTPAQT